MRSSATHVDVVEQAVRAGLAEARAGVGAPATLRVAIGLSGGRDSMVLLDALARLRETLQLDLGAVHVDHGLSPNASAWAAFCREQCAERGVPLACERVAIRRRGGESLEARARAARYDVLLKHDCDALALAHHADDQAETLLLQLLRGAGPHGIAAMAVCHRGDRRPLVLRPLLPLAAQTLAAYADLRGLRWIEDESNADARLRRNALRHRVVPALRESFPGYPATLVRAARHQAEAALLLDDLAALDAAQAVREDPAWGLVLNCTALRRLAGERAARARNLLRWFMHGHRLPAPSAAKLDEILAQCTGTRADSRATIVHAGRTLALHRNMLIVHGTPAAREFAVTWSGEPIVELPGGTLAASETIGRGIAAHWLEERAFVLRPRCGGERLALAPARRHQALTTLFRAIDAPAWQRDAWPLVWDDDALVAVPGIGIDPRYAASGAARGYDLAWTPVR